MTRWIALLVATCSGLLGAGGPFGPQPAFGAPTRTAPLTRALFHGGRTIRFPDGVVIALLHYETVRTRGLSWFPGGPPMRPPHGYRVVATTWTVRNTTTHMISIRTWRAKSRGKSSAMFITSNASEMGTIQPGTTQQYWWDFIVAGTGSVALCYGQFRAHWLPRGGTRSCG
jgi:hypothetical protein